MITEYLEGAKKKETGKTREGERAEKKEVE
jgi:hypothetical protein